MNEQRTPATASTPSMLMIDLGNGSGPESMPLAAAMRLCGVGLTCIRRGKSDARIAVTVGCGDAASIEARDQGTRAEAARTRRGGPLGTGLSEQGREQLMRQNGRGGYERAGAAMVSGGEG